MKVVTPPATPADRYRVKAAELNAKADQEPRRDLRSEYQRLAASYLLLAAQAERNSATDLVYEPPFQQSSSAQPVQQQQQQQQQQQLPPTRKPG